MTINGVYVSPTDLAVGIFGAIAGLALLLVMTRPSIGMHELGTEDDDA